MNKKSSGKNSITLPPLPNPHLEPLIELISDRQAEIEGCNGVVEYNDQLVSINCKRFILTVTGNNLTIKANTRDSITINGKFNTICFSAD